MTDPRTLRSRIARPAGVTLVELMVVLVFIAVGVLALSGVQTRSSSDVYKTGLHTRALALAQQRMEVAKSAGFTLAVPDSGTSEIFNWNTQIDSVNTDLRQIVVVVSWTEAGAPFSVELDNLMSSR